MGGLLEGYLPILEFPELVNILLTLPMMITHLNTGKGADTMARTASNTPPLTGRISEESRSFKQNRTIRYIGYEHPVSRIPDANSRRRIGHETNHTNPHQNPHQKPTYPRFPANSRKLPRGPRFVGKNVGDHRHRPYVPHVRYARAS